MAMFLMCEKNYSNSVHFLLVSLHTNITNILIAIFHRLISVTLTNYTNFEKYSLFRSKVNDPKVVRTLSDVSVGPLKIVRVISFSEKLRVMMVTPGKLSRFTCLTSPST